MTDESQNANETETSPDMEKADKVSKPEKEPKDAKQKKEAKDEEEHPPKFLFECQRTGDCCKREQIPISFNDLHGWVRDQTIFRVIHFFSLAVVNESLEIHLTKDDDGYCSLYHRDNKACTIHYNKPLYCSSYPLGFNGNNYVIKSNECTGIGKGKLSKEDLMTMRDLAFEDFVGRRQTSEVLPAIQSILFKQLTEESKRIMEDLPEEEKQRLTEMISKSKEEAEKEEEKQ
jgi:Fe-S-cluster containining protein